MNINSETLYTTEDLASKLNISLITAKRYIKKGIINSSKIGSVRRIKGSDILDLIKKSQKNNIDNSKSIKNGIHFYWSQKNPQLAHCLYEKYCKEGDIVMDPFLGAGSSLYGIRGLNLKFVGVEINEMPINIVKFNCRKNTGEDIKRILKKIRSIEKEFGDLYRYKSNKGEIFELKKVIYKSFPISVKKIYLELQDSLGNKYSGNQFPEIIEEHFSRFNYIKRKIKRISKGNLTKNTRIAVKEKANIIDIFSPINFYILTQLKHSIRNDVEVKFILSSVLHLLKLTDMKSQSQFPYWVPKKDILDRNVFHSLYKKTKELKNYANKQAIPVYSQFNDLIKASDSCCYLINKPIQKLKKIDLPDESVDIIVTDPPYFDQVAYSEYLKIWEYFLGFKSFFKDEVIQSQRVSQTSTEDDYLKRMRESFLVIRTKMKKNGKLFVYFKDSRPEKVQKFLEMMRAIGLKFSSQEHILKKKYTYKQNTTTDTTIVGECLMQFNKSEKLIKTDFKEKEDDLNVKSIIKKYVTNYLIQNKSATIGELYNNGLLKILYENNSLNLIKNTKSMNAILESFCKYESDRRTFSLKQLSFKNNLINGDSLKILKLIPDSSVDCCITDPPYNISGYDHKKEIGWYKSNKIWTKVKKFNKINEEWDKFSDLSYSDFTYEWVSEIKRIVKPNGNIAIFGSLHNIYKIGVILEELNLKIINSIIWFKRNAFPNITQRMFCESTEQIIWATNNSKKHAKNWTFNYKVMKELNNMKQMRNMWDIPNTPKSEKKFGRFPAQKSEKVLERLIKALTNKGDIIIDPFLGSGTTAVSAKKNNRHYIGIDNNKHYLEIAKKRLSNQVVTNSSNISKLTAQLSFEDLFL